MKFYVTEKYPIPCIFLHIHSQQYKSLSLTQSNAKSSFISNLSEKINVKFYEGQFKLGGISRGQSCSGIKDSTVSTFKISEFV